MQQDAAAAHVGSSAVSSGPAAATAQAALKKYIMVKPKLPALSSLLGQPDFYQLKSDEPEETLNALSMASLPFPLRLALCVSDWIICSLHEWLLRAQSPRGTDLHLCCLSRSI
jgi:hypothetical protein